MFVQDNTRKYSIEENSDSQDNQAFTTMFPKTDQFSHEQTLDLLKLKYNPKLHSTQLANYCYRSHKTHLVQFYCKFKDIGHQKLEEPPISNFYSNDCFTNLYELGRYLEGKIQHYPSIYMGNIPKNLKKILDNIFIQQGFIPNFERFLLLYPLYLEKHLTLEKTLFEDNRIDNKIAYFLGVIACAQMGSLYGLNRMLAKFSRVGGDLAWVSSKKYPEKISKLLELNRKLARCVWQIDSDLISEIVENNYWNQTDLALIIQILTFSHKFATISLATGLNCQQIDNQLIDFSALKKIKQDYDNLIYQPSQSQKLSSVIQNIGKMSSDQQQKSQKKLQPTDKKYLSKSLSSNRKTLKKSLRRSDNEQNVESYMKEVGLELSKQQLCINMWTKLGNLLDKYQVVGKRTDKDFPSIDASDANFKFTTFPMLYNLTDKGAEQALDLISYSQIMTSNNFGHSKVDNTKSFRKAIRYYCENLCGHFHFEYDYKVISQLLTMPLKFYIRLLTLSPLHINKQVLSQIKHEEGLFNLFDLGHVALIVANCKMGISLTCALNSFEE